MAYEVKARSPAGIDRFQVADRQDAVSRADAVLLGYLRDNPWCVVEVRDETGEVIHTRIEGTNHA